MIVDAYTLSAGLGLGLVATATVLRIIVPKARIVAKAREYRARVDHRRVKPPKTKDPRIDPPPPSDSSMQGNYFIIRGLRSSGKASG
jgi:hypothetical protein